MHKSGFQNTWLITKREYTERVRTKGFMIATIAIPLLMGGLVVGGGLLAARSKSSSHIAIVAADTTFASDLKQKIEADKSNNITAELATPSAETKDALDKRLKDKASGLSGYLWVVPAASPSARPVFRYKARSVGDVTTQIALEGAIKAVLLREQLTGKGMAPAEIDSLVAPVELDTSESGNALAALAAAYVMFLLMYMAIMLYGMNTARSIIEEKTSRVFEVLLATIKPDELLAGKIIGVGAVGLTQVGIWMLAAAALSTTSFAASLIGSGHSFVSLSQIAFFLLFFLFGFLLYSSIAAALGAMTNSEQELQQLNMFLVLPLAFCSIMVFPLVRAPNSMLSTVASLIPFCSPLLMNARLALTDVPAWQVWLSFALMALTIAAILWVSSRIYRVGILMYGKKPNLPEILRWLKYA
jgi:ABC-2 type transport system permease protein